MPLRPPLRAAVAPALVLSLALALPVTAQDRIPGGRLLTFGISTGLDASDNPDLDNEGDPEIAASTDLSLELLAATPTERFELGTNFGLDARAGGDPNEDDLTLSDPNASFLYGRQSRASELIIAGQVESEELDSRNPLEFNLDDLVGFEDEEELQELIAANEIPDDARRLTFNLNSSLETGRNAPLGIAYGLGLSGERYTNAPDAFEDETQLSAGLGLRFTLSDITEATLALQAARTLEDEQEQFTVDFDIGQERPAHDLGTSLGLVSENGELRTSLSLTGAIRRPTTVVSGEIGLTRADSGDLALTGSTALTHEITRTQDLTFNLRRQVTQLDDLDTGAADRERVVTSLQANYAYDVTSLWQLGLNARFTSATVVSDSDERDTYGEIGAGLDRSLTEDWSLNVELTHRFETNSDGPDARSNTISVSLDRTLRIPY